MKLWPRDLFAPAVAVVVFAVAGLVGALFFVTSSADTSARAHEEAVVANGMNVRISDIAEIAWSQIGEPHASLHLRGHPGLDWIHTHIGAPLALAGFEVTIALDARDQPVYVLDRGERVALERYSEFRTSAAALVALVRQIELARTGANADEIAAPIQASAVANVNERIYVLTVNVLAPARGQLTAASAPIVITAEEIDEDFLYVVNDRFLLDDLRLRIGADSAGEDGLARVALADAEGAPVAYLEWSPKSPGTELLRSALPPVGALIAGLGILGWAIYRRGKQAARLLIAGKAQATHLAYHDGLTGLPNRLLLADRLGRAVEDLRRRNAPFAVHCIDLDRFKSVNDTFGHQAGDEVIQTAAKRISDACRQLDTIARLGGDEFAVVQIGATLDGAARLAERLVASLAEPMELSFGRVHIGGSVGVTLLNETAIEPQECLHQGDLALYQAKQAGRNGYCFFSPEMDATVHFRKEIEADLREAIERRQFYLAYQPQVDGRGKIIGVEALLRWNHPLRGSLSPSAYIPIAEEVGLIDAIGFFTLRRAFEDSQRWPGLKVAINVSPVQLRSKGFAEALSALVTETGIDPTTFELEITEGVLLGDDTRTHDTLRQVRDLGFRLALDDFGTGYSSLSYLHRYPIDKIKIDRSFVTNLGVDKDADAIIAAIVRLARALNLTVIAEGVETDEQRLRLVLAGCSDMQGFLVGKPAMVETIDKLLAAEHHTYKRASRL